MESMATWPWYGVVLFSIATAILAWVGGRTRRRREEAETDASVTGLGGLRQIMETMRQDQMFQAKEIERLRHLMIDEASKMGRLRARVAHLESLLRTAGIPVPPETGE
ncbi:hypothetical protein UU9_12413 [Rhodanobacter fulvus Jip2]|uniref:Uncharacterized protein n=2 Tax=Rhodanobacter TaxID=75309 RepID=I4VMW1_9GAMM|nr:hypothetical protein UU9_12413 [Rhodanobacter fulvus Jip2]